MLRILLIPLLTILVVLILLGIVIAITRYKPRSREKELDEKYIYRKEPHADQVTEHPNRLSDNDVTRG